MKISEETLELIDGVVATICELSYYSQDYRDLANNTIKYTIENNTIFSKVFQEVYDEFYVKGNSVIEQTEQNITSVINYLFNDLVLRIHQTLIDNEIKIKILIEFTYKHSTYYRHTFVYKFGIDSNYDVNGQKLITI